MHVVPALGVSVDEQWFRSRHSSTSVNLSPGPRSPALSSSTQTTPLDLTVTPATPNSAAAEDSCASIFFQSATSTHSTWQVTTTGTQLDQKVHEEIEIHFHQEPEFFDDLVQSPTSLNFEQPSILQQMSVQAGLQAGPGNRRGLLIGVRYWGTDNVLDGAYADVDDMKRLLIEKFSWEEDDFTILKDDKTDPGSQPTRDIILREMGNLVRGARPGDQLFFHFAGHGGQVPDKDGDELDELDEEIKTCDDQSVVDDEMFDVLVKPLPRGCRLTAVFDCCNSGTGLDLPEIVKGTSIPTFRRISRSRSPSPNPPTTKLRRVRPRAPFRRLTNPREDEVPPVEKAGRPGVVRKDSDGDVILWSACQDSEDAFEMKIEGAIRGAMSYNFIRALRAQKHSYRSLLDDLSMKLQEKGKSVQTPQLSGSRPIPMDALVSI